MLSWSARRLMGLRAGLISLGWCGLASLPPTLQARCANSAKVGLPVAHRGRTLCAMDNGHHYPSEYTWHFGERVDHPATQHQVVGELQRCYAGDWPTIWGTIWAHREACMLAALRALDGALAEPKVTRQGLRRKMIAALEAIAARGPEAIPIRPRRD